MNLQEYKLLLQHPESITADQTAALQLVIRQYPFLQSAYAMRLKGLYNENSYQYNHTLKLAAAYTTDRTVLFDFITSDDFAKIANPAIVDEETTEISRQEEISHETETPTIEQSILDSIEQAEAATEILEKNISREYETPSIEQPILDTIEQVIISGENSEIETDKQEAENSETPASENETNEETETTFKSVEDELGTPLEFSVSETHSFNEWLQLSKIQPIVREEIVEEKVELSEIEIEKNKKIELIDKFIIASPKIPPVKNDTKVPVIRDTPADTSALMTETLARVYLEQKKYQKAIQAYQILILKYPEKSSFFADRISDIKKIQQNN